MFMAPSEIHNAMGIVGKINSFPNMRLRTSYNSLGDETYPNFEEQSNAFLICQAIPGIIVAGGCVSCIMDPNTDFGKRVPANQMASDVDLYVRSNDPNEARATVRKLCDFLHPKGDVLLSKCAMSMEIDSDTFNKKVIHYQYLQDSLVMAYNRKTKPGRFYRIQIISQLIPDTGDPCKDLHDLLLQYDLPCCSFATDGKNIYGTNQAIDAMFRTRMVRAHWTNLTSPSRMAKYYNRGFDFEIEGPDGNTLNVHPNSKGAGVIYEKLNAHKTITRDVNDDDKMTPYDAHTSMCSSDTNILTLSLQKFICGDTDPMVPIVCGDAETDIDHLLLHGTMSPAYILDWMCLTMNSFCETLLTDNPMISPEEEDISKSKFALKLDEFMSVVKDTLKVPLLFNNGTKRVIPPNLDFEVFARDWCIPNDPMHGPIKREDKHLGSNMPLNVTLGSDERDMKFRKGCIFYIGFQSTISKVHMRCEVMTPELELLYTPDMFKQFLLGLGFNWANNPELVHFRTLMDFIDSQCEFIHEQKTHAKETIHVDHINTIKENPCWCLDYRSGDVTTYQPFLKAYYIKPQNTYMGGYGSLIVLETENGKLQNVDFETFRMEKGDKYTMRLNLRLDWIYGSILSYEKTKFHVAVTKHWTATQGIIKKIK
jgi:hypothetical protein